MQGAKALSCRGRCDFFASWATRLATSYPRRCHPLRHRYAVCPARPRLQTQPPTAHFIRSPPSLAPCLALLPLSPSLSLPRGNPCPCDPPCNSSSPAATGRYSAVRYTVSAGQPASSVAPCSLAWHAAAAAAMAPHATPGRTPPARQDQAQARRGTATGHAATPSAVRCAPWQGHPRPRR